MGSDGFRSCLDPGTIETMTVVKPEPDGRRRQEFQRCLPCWLCSKSLVRIGNYYVGFILETDRHERVCHAGCLYDLAAGREIRGEEVSRG